VWPREGHYIQVKRTGKMARYRDKKSWIFEVRGKKKKALGGIKKEPFVEARMYDYYPSI